MQFSLNRLLLETFPVFSTLHRSRIPRWNSDLSKPDRNKFLNNTHFKAFWFLVVWILKVEDEKIIKILIRLNPILCSEICSPFEEIEKASIAPNYLKCPQIAIGVVLFFLQYLTV